MSLNDVYNGIYEQVMLKDKKEQQKFLNVIFELRGQAPVDLSKYKAIFIPNNDYLKYYDLECTDIKYGLYTEDGSCLWDNYLLLPIINLAGIVKGFAGFNPFIYADVHNGNSTDNYYSYSSKQIMKKGSFMFAALGTYRKAIEDGYTFITDGIFDSINLSALGFNSMALMGSSLTQEIIFQLRFINRVILVSDNDEAGLKLAGNLKNAIKTAEIIKLSTGKDIDFILKQDDKQNVINKLKSVINNKVSDKIRIF